MKIAGLEAFTFDDLWTLGYRVAGSPERVFLQAPLASPTSSLDLLLRVNEQLLKDRDVSLSRFDRPEVLLCPDAIIVDLGDHDPRPIG